MRREETKKIRDGSLEPEKKEEETRERREETGDKIGERRRETRNCR